MSLSVSTDTEPGSLVNEIGKRVPVTVKVSMSWSEFWAKVAVLMHEITAALRAALVKCVRMVFMLSLMRSTRAHD